MERFMTEVQQAIAGMTAEDPREALKQMLTHAIEIAWSTKNPEPEAIKAGCVAIASLAYQVYAGVDKDDL